MDNIKIDVKDIIKMQKILSDLDVNYEMLNDAKDMIETLNFEKNLLWKHFVKKYNLDTTKYKYTVNGYDNNLTVSELEDNDPIGANLYEKAKKLFKQWVSDANKN